MIAWEHGIIDDVIMPSQARRRIAPRWRCCGASGWRDRQGSTIICRAVAKVTSMTTIVREYIQALPERWARNGVIASVTVLLVSLLTSDEYHGGSLGITPFVRGTFVFVVPATLIGYSWGYLLRSRFFSVMHVSEASVLMKSLSTRCAMDGAVILSVVLLIGRIGGFRPSGLWVPVCVYRWAYARRVFRVVHWGRIPGSASIPIGEGLPWGGIASA